MGILFGLLAALGWGGGDFAISQVTRVIGVTQAMFYVQLFGIVAISAVLLVRHDLPPTDLSAWGLGIAANVVNVGGTLLLYRAFAIGTLSIVSPIVSSFALITALLALLTGERPGLLALGGAALVIVGVVIAARSPGGVAGRPRGVIEAMGAAVCIGIYCWSISYITPTLGIAWPVLIGRLMAFLVAMALMARSGSRPVRLGRAVWPFAVGAGVLDTAAFLCFSVGVSGAYVSVVTALASIFSVVTVLLAWVFLRERLSMSQWAGVAGLLVGVLLVSL
ncbi:MAG: DMT family transporter [Chloroflexales bacterium]